MCKNPARVNIILPIQGTSAIYQIYKLSGQLIDSGEFSASILLDISTFQKGVYVIKVLSEGRLFSKKIIIN
jgi:hypothetical protein